MNAPQTAKVLKQLFMESSWDYKEVKIWLFTGSISDFFYFQGMMIYNVFRDNYKFWHFYSILNKNEWLDL